MIYVCIQLRNNLKYKHNHVIRINTLLFKVILYSYLILKKMNERITDS